MANEKIEIVIGAKDEYSRELDKAKQSVGEVSSAQSASFSSLQSSAALAVGALALVYGSIRSLEAAWDMAREAANYGEQKTALAALAGHYNTTADAMIGAFQRAVSNTVSQAEAMAASVRALHADMSPALIEKYAAAAERLSPVLGVSTVEAFNNFSHAAAMGQEKLLKSLDIQVNLISATDEVGKHMSASAIQAKNYQLVADALDKSMRNLGEDSLSAADKLDQMEAAVKDINLLFKEYLVPTISSVSAELARMMRVGIEAIAAITPKSAEEKRIEEWRIQVEKFDEQLKVATGTAKNFWGNFSVSSDYEINNLKQMRAELLGWIAESEAAIAASAAKKAALKAASGKGSKEGDKEDPAAKAAAIKSYEEMDAKIQGVYFATEKLGASKARLVELEAYEATAASTNIDQINRYTAALDAKAAKEDELAVKKEQNAAVAKLYALEDKDPYKAVEKAGQTELALIQRNYIDKTAALQQYNADVITAMMNTGATQSEMEAKYTELSLSYAEKRKNFQIQAAADTSGALSNIAQNLYVATGKKNKEMFYMMKGFAVAQATIKGALLVVEAMEDGAKSSWWLALAYGVAAAAEVAAILSTIKSAEPDSAGSVKTAGGGTASAYTGGSAGSQAPPTYFEGANNPTSEQKITINVYNPLNGEVSADVQDAIVAAVNGAAKRNVRIDVQSMGAT